MLVGGWHSGGLQMQHAHKSQRQHCSGGHKVCDPAASGPPACRAEQACLAGRPPRATAQLQLTQLAVQLGLLRQDKRAAGR